MKISGMVLVVSVACLPGLAAADELATVGYSGNGLGRQVCKAVVQDDIAKLKRVLRSYQNTLAYGYTQSRDRREVARDFTCNGMGLEAFSDSIGARNVSGYFAGDSTMAKEQLAATAE